MTGKVTRNFDKLDALILLAGDVLMEKNVKYANSIDTSDCIISKYTDRKIKRYIKKASMPREQKMWILATKRVVAVLLITCTILFVGAMSIEAVRNELWNAIVEWYDEYISVRFESLVPTTTVGMIETREPSYLPSGLKVADKEVTEFRCKITYEYNGEKSLIFIQRPSTTKVLIDDVGCTIENIKINDYAGVIAEYSEGNMQYVLMWDDGKYSFVLKFYVSEYITTSDELLKIAESLY